MMPKYKAGDRVFTKDGEKIVTRAYPTIGQNVVYTLEKDSGLWEERLLRPAPSLQDAPGQPNIYRREDSGTQGQNFLGLGRVEREPGDDTGFE